MLEQVGESPGQQSGRRGARKPCQLCSCHGRWQELAEVGDSTTKPTTAHPAGHSVCPPLAPRAWLEGAGSGTEWGPSVRDTSGPLGPKPTEPWLNSTTWWTCWRLHSQAFFLLFRFWCFFRFSQHGSVTIRIHCPLIGSCLDTAHYQRAQPRHFKQGRKINPPKKELLVSKPPTQC